MRVERTTYSLGGCRSIQLSYEHATSCQISYFNFKCQENKKCVALPEATPSPFGCASLHRPRSARAPLIGQMRSALAQLTHLNIKITFFNWLACLYEKVQLF